MRPPLIRHAADWRAIVTLDAYRFLVAFGLVTVLITGAGARVFAPALPDVFRVACLIYLAQCVLTGAAAAARHPALKLHVVLVVAIDVVFFTVLSLASSGVAGGFGMLLITPLAAAGTLLSARLAAFLGACAVIGILGQEAWRLHWAGAHAEFVQAGILGSLYFIAIAIAHGLARRAAAGEALAADAAGQVRDLAEINRRIIGRMQIGAVVVDAQHRISLINDAALDLLDLRATGSQGRGLAAVAPALAEALTRWQSAASAHRAIVRAGGRTLLPAFSALDNAADAPVLIFLEDALRRNEAARQVKLMSLGRLTASIAHEIRNPLGAISHAGQLLAESSRLGADETRLLDIIHRHSRRIDAIIDDVLGLSRRADASFESIALSAWLHHSIADYRQSNTYPPRFIVDGADENLRIDFDRSHLRQVLFNLWDNASRYARRADRPLELRLASRRNRAGHPLLEIADNGPGIAAGIAEQILEPFFTTARDGTGLGLYIARELCEVNGAELTPVARASGACFRITFAQTSLRRPAAAAITRHE
jgi:two-component system sensor histidine kinase PilS (NtrC family)